MESLIQINKKLKISIGKLEKLMGNCDEVNADTIFFPVMRDYQTLASEIVSLELLYVQQKESPELEKIKFIEETLTLANTALSDIDEALNLAIDEHHAT
jgi:hypothetical protein